MGAAFRTHKFFICTALKCPKIAGANRLFFKIAGAKATIAPVLNRPLQINLTEY